MIVQFIFCSIFIFTFLIGILLNRVYGSIANFYSFVSFLGFIYVLFPSLGTLLANIVGLKRGADLVLYTSLLVAFITNFLLYCKYAKCLQLITELNREIALINTEIKINNDSEF